MAACYGDRGELPYLEATNFCMPVVAAALGKQQVLPVFLLVGMNWSAEQSASLCTRVASKQI